MKLPTARKSPTDLAIDIAAGSADEPSGYGEEYGGGEEDEMPLEDEQPASDPQALLDKIQANIDQLRASF